MYKSSHTILTLLTFVILVFGSCSRSRGGQESEDISTTPHDTLPAVVPEIVKAIEENDPAKFASKVSYPIERPYPLRNIEDSAAMANYFPVLIDDSLRHVLKNADKSRWTEAGWRGWTLDDGKYLWIDGQLYSIDYVSAAEKALKNLLIKQEMESLHPDMQQGWLPEMCLLGVADGTIYRIDLKSDTQNPDSAKDEDEVSDFRLAVYSRDSDLHGRPRRVLNGKRHSEGSASTRWFHFDDGNGTVAEYYIDGSDDSEPVITVITPRNDTITRPVERVYWLDYVAKPRPMSNLGNDSLVTPMVIHENFNHGSLSPEN